MIDAVAALSDSEYQRRVWVDRILPEENFYDDLTLRVHILYDDTTVLPDPASAIGDILLGGAEIARLTALDRVLGPLIDELGEADDLQYLNHPRWPEVVRLAGHALSALVLSGGWRE
ncbi:hypothetical protein [Nocardia sp. NPDC051750]|uniref:SCO4402 family protein n=1 Tax=Nocardia sp. NPDC051750 TaxID=3364325 RepID=UPI00379A37EE